MFSLQGILSIPIHAFVTFIQINHFCKYKYDYLLWHLRKMTCNHINDSKVVCNYICDLSVTDVNLDENKNEEYIFIIHFYHIPKK
jgi:hypothetical protein